MRKVLILVGLAAIVAVAQVGSAGATGGLPVPDVNLECKTVFIEDVDVDQGVSVEKEILIDGEAFGVDISKRLVRVDVNRITVEVCVKVIEGDVVTEIDLESALKGIGECPNGGHGANIVAPVTLKAGLTGGTVVATVKIDVDGKAQILEAKEDRDYEVEEKLTIPLGPTMVTDRDTIKSKVCIGRVGVK